MYSNILTADGNYKGWARRVIVHPVPLSRFPLKLKTKNKKKGEKKREAESGTTRVEMAK
jgi:hypothetical protein